MSADFITAYSGVREASHELTLEASPVGLVMRDLMASKGDWSGTASDLLAELDALAGEKSTKQKTWPKSGRALGNLLRRLAPTLRAVGISITFERDTDKARRRIIRLTAVSSHSTTGDEDMVCQEEEFPTEEKREVEMF